MASETRDAARAEVESYLPHRDPFLFVDRIVERSDQSIVTEWDVSPELDCFRGHYPGQPVLPGVLISEFLFQSGAIMLYASENERFRDAPGVPVLARIERARFKRMAGPGSVLRAEVQLERAISTARYLTGKVTADGALVCDLRFTLALAPGPNGTS